MVRIHLPPPVGRGLTPPARSNVCPSSRDGKGCDEHSTASLRREWREPGGEEEYGPMNLPQTGGCQCGALRYEITQASYMVYACHCTDCQRMTSSAFSMAIVLPAEAFRLIAGKPRVIERIADSGRVTTRWVCPECGSWISPGPRPGSTVRNVR